MSKVYGEAIQDNTSKKWGFVIKHSDGSVISEPSYDFDTQKDAEDELIRLLQELGRHSKNP